MKKVTEQERKRINIAAANFLCEQEEGDYCDAYLKLVEESEKGNGFHNANNYIEVWQGVENMTVENLLDAIDSAIVEPVVPKFIQKIDWSELRNQKTALVNHIADLRNDSSEVNQIKAKNELADYLEGILSLIDGVQDYAVDVAEIAKEIDVYDFDLEDSRD